MRVQIRETLGTIVSGLNSINTWKVAILWIICLLYVLFQGGKTSFMLFTMVSILALYWAIGGFSGIRRIKGKRQLGLEGERTGLLKAGEQIIVKLTLELPAFMPLPYIIVQERLEKHNGESWIFEDSIVPHQHNQSELIFQTPPLERGRYSFAGTVCSAEDIFGLMKHKGVFHTSGEFSILPRTVFIQHWYLHSKNSRVAGPEATLSLSRRETTQINGVRDYVYGDRFSRIHWNATAKTGAWKSKEFEHESLQKTVLVLDTHSISYKSTSQFELAVSTAASLLEYGARQKMNIGLCTLGQKFRGFAPAESYLERQQMLHHLVDITADGYGGYKEKLEANREYFPKGAFFILITPLADEQAMGMLRWAGSRRMLPYHILIEDETSIGGKYTHWSSLLKDRNIFGIRVSSLTNLPSALGGEK
ncbi:Uncharacterized conserved protein, DUF58 family, contains vWF domain [Fontibacillus panacisegetis]|uniref:Uncharacterized conserved protein, DUF58 family, contains vWF domain n=1 Tax=Fontibacillus panacisegetis TaxID=670482 RepID=A0A1G7FZQ1_9BACL|nr:DUF58 domain-containing protein [Fontibacillus panacisegetis]SDE81386.1 Uncharacterized conserved protein, DUF58 family, contains vWF domain [Fontibacillus panacisegetis]